MEIIYNKDKSVTIKATESEYGAICAAVGQMYTKTLDSAANRVYKPIFDAMNKAYNERIRRGFVKSIHKL